MDSSHPPIRSLSSKEPPRLFMCSALYLAVCHGRNEEVMALLLQQHGAQAPATDQQTPGMHHGQCDMHETSPERNTLLHLAAKQGHNELIREIYSSFRDKSLLSSQNKELDTPLHCAARAGHDTTVSLLVQLVQDSGDSGILGGKNEAGDTTLHLAARHGHGAAVEAVVSAAPELATEVNNAGVSPLYLAVVSGSVSAVRAITTRCRDASAVGPSSQNALHAAVFQGSEMVNLLLKWEPSLADQVDHNNSSSPLHFASSHGDCSVVSAILRAAQPSMVYKQDLEGLSAFHVAAGMGHAGVINDLMEAYPEAVELRDHCGITFLHSAAKRGHFKVLLVAIKNPKLAHHLLGAQDRDGNTPLHLAVEARSPRAVHTLMSKGRVQANIMNNDGKTPYDLAVKFTSAFQVINLVVTLIVFGARSQPQRQDHVQEWSGGRDKVGYKMDRTADSLAVIAILITTVALGAAYNISGSYKDNGMAALDGEIMFECFVVLDSIALATSVLSVILLVYGKASGSLRSWNSIAAASHLIWASLVSMILAFYAALAAVTCTMAVYIGTLVAIYLLLGIPINIIMNGVPREVLFITAGYKFLLKGGQAIIKRRTGRQYPFVAAYVHNLIMFMAISCASVFGMVFVGLSARRTAPWFSGVPSLAPAPAPNLI